MEITLDIGLSVWLKKSEKIGIITAQMEREQCETELWFEIQDENGKKDHYPESEFDVDLFQFIDKLPEEVQEILERYNEEDSDDYNNLANMLKEVQAYGYTFEYYLTAEPYALRKISE